MSDEQQIECGEGSPREIVEIHFQKNPSRKLKYLESEPKILGVTQIVSAVFLSFAMVAFYVNDVVLISDAASAVTSLIIIIAGSLAVAAQSLHLPTLKACLGMQVVACMAAVICLFIYLITFPTPYHCWLLELELSQRTTCKYLNIGLDNYQTLRKFLMAVQIGLSATLAVYCCKVIQCCSPVSSVPVITVNRPPDRQ